MIDSVDQTDFLTGKQDKSNRDGFMVYVGSDLFGIKWRNWKMMFKEVERGTDDKRTFRFPAVFQSLCGSERRISADKSNCGSFLGAVADGRDFLLSMAHRCRRSLQYRRERRTPISQRGDS